MDPACSFCGDRPVVAWFEGPHFRNAVDSADKVRADEAWLACSDCLALVQANDRDGLAMRKSLRLHRESRQGSSLSDEAEDFVELMRRHLEETFWAARSG